MLRFAPSPTGYLHAGNARIAILNYLFAQKNELDYILRIDNTDSERSKNEYEAEIRKDLDWLGLKFKSSFSQAKRIDIYKDISDDLKNNGYLYPCYETPKELEIKRKLQLKSGKPPLYDRSSLKLSRKEISKLHKEGRKPHWRFRLSNNPIKWNDLVHGIISFENLPISDPIVIRSDGTPLFTLTSVIDDAELKVSNVIRGDDHITNTASQIQLFEILGGKIPNFAHVPLIKLITGEQMSKRSNSFSLKHIRKKGIQPSVVFNMLSKLGSKNQYNKIEKYEEILESFDIKNFSKSTVKFNFKDLERMNINYLSILSFKEISKIIDTNINEEKWLIIKSNFESVDDIKDWLYIISKDFKNVNDDKNINLFKVAAECLPERISVDTWRIWSERIKKKTGMGGKKLFLPLRLKLTGKNNGPEMNQIISILDKDEILRRLS